MSVPSGNDSNPVARFRSTLWQHIFITKALVQRDAEFLGCFHEAFVALEIGVIFRHRIRTEIALALLVKPPTDLSEGLDCFEQRRCVLVGTLQRPWFRLQCRRSF